MSCTDAVECALTTMRVFCNSQNRPEASVIGDQFVVAMALADRNARIARLLTSYIKRNYVAGYDPHSLKSAG